MLDAFQFVFIMKLHRSRERVSAERVILPSYITYLFAPATESICHHRTTRRRADDIDAAQRQMMMSAMSCSVR